MDYDRLKWWIKFFIPIIISFPFLFKLVVLDESKPKSSPCLGIVILTALGWMFEHIPIAITAFVPIVLLPLFGVSTGSSIASAMFSDTSLTFLGGFIFSIAMIRWNLHSRIALKVVLICGLRPKILFLGMMLVTAFLGMWISNTATALTMIPNAMAVVSQLEEIVGDPKIVEPFAKCLLLGIAFCSSAGGFSTLTGTPPNLIFAQISESIFPKAPSIGWTKFFFVSAPTAWGLVIIIYIFLTLAYLRKVHFPEGMSLDVFRENYAKLGKMRAAEWAVSLLFILLAFLWLFRADLDFGSFVITGWANAICGPGLASYIKDGTVAIGVALLLFVIHVPPNTPSEEKTLEKEDVDLEIKKTTTIPVPHQESSELFDVSDDSELQEERSETTTTILPPKKPDAWVPLLEWEYVQSKIPWSILFLFSGGFALNRGFTDSGLDQWIGSALKGMTNMSEFVLLLLITLITTLLTNIASNTACANILLPIIASIAREAQKYHPWVMMLVCTFMTSCCYLMPVSTPPNLVAYGTGKLKFTDFLIAGGIINLISIFFIIGMCLGLVPPVFDAYGFPDWAKPDA